MPRFDHPLLPPLVLLITLGFIVLAGAVMKSCDEPDDEEGKAVLCDIVCVDVDEGDKSRCDFICEDPEIEVSCGKCGYVIRSGKAIFECIKCDWATY